MAALVAATGLQPGVLLATGVAVVAAAVLLLLGGAGGGSTKTVGQALFGAYVALGRARNIACGPCYRATKRYPVASTCQIPFFKSLPELLTFVFGYKTDGVFVEVGAYDGESFSNTSGLADIGWTGHYLEPIPAYAAACAARHAGNPRVTVHAGVCIGEKDGEPVELSTAGPFSTAVDDEVAAISTSSMNGVLQALGWAHQTHRVKATTTSLNTFFTKTPGLSKPGAVDVMVVDVEGMEWPIFRAFRSGHFRPKLVIVEIQQLLRRYVDNPRAQADAAALFKHFSDAGYAILYKDVINTVFVHKDWKCVGGD